MKLDEVIAEAITQQDLDQLEIYADRLFAKVGIDVEFTRHFLDRVNDERNQKDITIGELTRLFKQEFKRWGKPIAQLGPDAEAVMKDMQTDINVPFVLKWDNKNGELDLVAKTVMRKKNFYTPDKEFPVEGYMTATPANPLAMMGQPSRSGVGKDSLGTLNVVSKSAQQDYDEYDQKQQAQDARQGALQSQIDQIKPAKSVSGLAQRKVKTNEESPWDMFKNAALPVVQKKFYDHAAKTLHSVLMRKKQENNLKHGLGYYAQQIARTFDGMSWRALLKHYGEVYGDNVVTELKIERPDPADTMGITRDKMPQVKREDYPEFIDYLKDNGAKFSKETVGPRTLKPIQGEFSDAGVEKAITLNKVEKPIIASSDNYIIDGHHRWLAAINTGQDVLIYRVNIPGEQLLKLVLAFPKTYFKPISENFADGKVKGKSRPGRVKAAGASCDGSVTELRAKAKKASGEKAKMYHWCANMKAGRQKAESTVSGGVAHTGGWNQDATAQSNGWQGMTKSMRGSFNPNSNKNKNKSSWINNMLQRTKDTVFGEGIAIVQLDAPTPTVFDLAKKHDVPVRQIQDQLAKGIKVEMEHTQDPKVAQEIALDHIAELPDYYDRLLFVEDENDFMYKVGRGITRMLKGDPNWEPDLPPTPQGDWSSDQYKDAQGNPPSDAAIQKLDQLTRDYADAAGISYADALAMRDNPSGEAGDWAQGSDYDNRKLRQAGSNMHYVDGRGEPTMGDVHDFNQRGRRGADDAEDDLRREIPNFDELDAGTQKQIRRKRAELKRKDDADRLFRRGNYADKGATTAPSTPQTVWATDDDEAFPNPFESVNETTGVEMLKIFRNMHHDTARNKEMDAFIKAHEWELRDFTPDMFPSEEEFFDYDDPFDRVIDIDYHYRVDLSQPIIVGPQYSDGKYSVIDGNHRAAQAQQMGKTIKGYFPVKKVNETAGVGKIVKGVNTTVDVGTNEIQKQAKKWGFSVDKDGRPGLLMNAINNMGKKNGK